jgi:signal transduction histidine kinase/ligand-binding sensor domain-containing protein
VRFSHRAVCFVWHVAALTSVCLGLDPHRAISQYHKTHWQVEDGLPRNYVMAVLPAEDRYLLVGTDEGLVRFDGVRFSRFEGASGLGLGQRWIVCMVPARGGGLWLGTFDGWVYRLSAGRVTATLEAGASVFALFEDAAGTLWASTRHGVLRTRDGRFERVEGLAGPPDMAWNVLAADTENAIWIVTVDGVFRARNGVVSRVVANEPRYGEILSVVADRQGGVWMGADKGLFSVRAPHGAVAVRPVSGVPGPVVALLPDRDGVLWAGTWGQGLYRVRGAAVDSWAERDGLADNFIRTLSEDGEGDLWIGSRSGGLMRWNDTFLAPYGTPEGLRGDFASVVTEDRRGDLWFGTWRGGIYRFRQGTFEPQPTPAPTLYFAVRALAFAPDGNPWIGNWEGLYGFDGGRYRQYAGPDAPYRHVSGILFDRAGRLWVGSDNGLFLFSSGRPAETPRTLAAGTDITSLFEDSLGRVWVGLPDGLGRVDGRDPALTRLEGLPRDTVTSVTEDSRGRICASTMGGALYVVADGRAGVLDRRHGLPGYPLYRVLDDGRGSYWISSGHGILQVGLGQVDEALGGGSRRLEVALYDRNDGMRTIECHRISQPAGWRDRSGRIWFPTAKGFVEIQPDRPRPAAAPPVAIESVTADGRPLPAGPEIRLAPGTHSLEFQFTAFRFAHPEKVRLRYRLEGFDPAWVEAGADRSARYSRIPPGGYRFLVSARMASGDWGTEAAVIPVRQLPRFDQTYWFIALLALASAAAAAALFRWKVFLIKGRYAAVLAERNRIAREWHDTLLAGFSAISWQLEETLSRLKDSPSGAAEAVQLALKMVRYYRTEARRVIGHLRENRLDSEGLAASVEASLRQLTAGTAIRGEVQVNGRAPKLGEDVERNALRITQEAAANAKNHGQPSRIGISIDYEPDALRLRIEDDGAGFDPGGVAGVSDGHFGLTMMRERAERFGGTVTFASRPTAGTVVEAKIPLKAGERR